MPAVADREGGTANTLSVFNELSDVTSRPRVAQNAMPYPLPHGAARLGIGTRLLGSMAGKRAPKSIAHAIAPLGQGGHDRGH